MARTQIEILKWMAFASMVIDHGAKSDLFSMPGWQIFGRLAFPLFALTFAYSAAEKERVDVRRLLVLGCVAQPAFCSVLGMSWYQLNILFLFPAAWYVHQHLQICRLRDVLLAGSIFVGAELLLTASYGAIGVATVAAAIAGWRAKATLRWSWFGLAALGATVSVGDGTAAAAVALIVAGLLLVAYEIGIAYPQLLVKAGYRRGLWRSAGFGRWYVLHLWLLAFALAHSAATATIPGQLSDPPTLVHPQLRH